MPLYTLFLALMFSGQNFDECLISIIKSRITSPSISTIRDTQNLSCLNIDSILISTSTDSLSISIQEDSSLSYTESLICTRNNEKINASSRCLHTIYASNEQSQKYTIDSLAAKLINFEKNKNLRFTRTKSATIYRFKNTPSDYSIFARLQYVRQKTYLHFSYRRTFDLACPVVVDQKNE